MKKLLIGEITALVLLVAAALFIRVGITEPGETESTGTESSSDVQVIGTETLGTEGSTGASGETTETSGGITLPDFSDIEITAKNAFVYSLDDGLLLYSKGTMDEVIYPASITKLFTAYVALQYLDPETMVTVGSEVNLIASDSSVAYIYPGFRLTAAQLVEGMILPSGNDAAYAIAVAAARAESGNSNMGAQAAIAHFVDMMNQTAQAMGMTGSHFCNPDGYTDDDHYTCGQDLVTIARLALENETIRTYVGTETDNVTYASGQIMTWHNTNVLLKADSPYYCADAVGMKTGFTSQAGNCLLSTFEVDGKYYVAGTFGCPEKNDRFADSLKLYNEVILPCAALLGAS